MLRKDLDGDGAIEAGVPRSVDLTHPTGAQRGDDLVGPESRASRQSHIEARKIDRCGEWNIIRSPSPLCLQDWGALQSTTSFHEGNECPAGSTPAASPTPATPVSRSDLLPGELVDDAEIVFATAVAS